MAKLNNHDLFKAREHIMGMFYGNDIEHAKWLLQFYCNQFDLPLPPVYTRKDQQRDVSHPFWYIQQLFYKPLKTRQHDDEQ